MSPTATDDAVATTIPTFSLTRLFASPLNPRKRFTPESLADLQANIQKRGEVIQPLLLRTNGDRFEIIDGERRWRAATGAGNILWVPGQVRDDLTDGECIEIMLLSSIQKQDLTPLEEAHGFKALIDSNPSRYSRAYIADRIGRSEKWVWDRMKLLDLIPILKKLLDADRILVGHGELLCKLKPEDQERAVGWDGQNLMYRKLEGLWETEHNRLKLDDDEDDEEPSPKNLYRGLKAVTVKELESWIAHHVRFDVEHMAKSAPLEFAETAQQVEAAAAQPGRGKKVIAITHEYRVSDDARDASERTYGSNSWQRADGVEKSKTCDHSVLGVFVAGRGQGTSLQVCIHRDKCKVHFAEVIREREKNAKLRQQGKGGQAAQREKKAEESSDQKWRREAAEREAREEAWEKVWPALRTEALRQVKDVKVLTEKQAKALERDTDMAIEPRDCKAAGITWWKNLPLALLVTEISRGHYCDDFKDFVKQCGPLGLDIKKRYDNNSSNLVRRSDQWPFLQRGVPALGFMTGLHPDYHTQYDRPEKINYAKMEKIARLIHQASPAAGLTPIIGDSRMSFEGIGPPCPSTASSVYFSASAPPLE